MGPANIELLMGHSIGISKSYYKPTENEILEDYFNAIDLLTIDRENKFQRGVKELQKNKDNDYLINLKLYQSEQEIQKWREKDTLKEDTLANLSDQLLKLTQRLQKLEKRTTFTSPT